MVWSLATNYGSFTRPHNSSLCYNIGYSKSQISTYTPQNIPYKQSVNYETELKKFARERANAALLENVTYTISPFIHVPFPQQNSSYLATPQQPNTLNQYTKIVTIGENKLTVSFHNPADVLPSGIYPRRFFSYLCKSVISTRKKNKVIKLPRSKSQFLKEILKINYACCKKETDAINAQLKALTNCNLTIDYSNPNDASRLPYSAIQFFAGDCSFLHDDNQDWQTEITLSNEMFELIKSNSVPISEHAVNTFTSARKLDVYNYFSYQNYNLYQKNLNHVYDVDVLKYLFGGAIEQTSHFRRVFKKILTDLKEISTLDIARKGRYYYALISNAESLLKKKERRKTNKVIETQLNITEDFKEKLEKQTKSSSLNVESACLYVAKRIQRWVERGGKPVANQHAYLRDVLNNPSWFYKEKQSLIKLTHQLQFQEYEKLPKSARKQGADELVHRIKLTRISSVPIELQPVLEQLRTSGRTIISLPNWNYICYLFWAWNFEKRLDVCDDCQREQLLLDLFKHLVTS